MAKIPKHKLSGKFALNNETLIRKVKNDRRDSIAVEIGDSKQPDFKPQFKVSRWNNEVNFSMRAEEHPEAVIDIEGEVVKYKAPSYEVHQYEKPEAGEDGGFEFEWVLPSKPESNTLIATIQTKGLDFFYQPTLTGEEIESGALRPDNVVGSYAVYHRLNKNNHYKTGKAFHIYRPEAIDANGNKTWCELYIDIDTEVLTVTIPEKFLESAAYPVVVDPTFGYTSVGASTTTVATNLPSTIRVGNQAVLSEAGVISSINVALRATGTTQNVDTSVFLNTENTTTDSHTLVAFQERTLLPVTTTATFYNFDVSGSVTAGDYVISVVCDGNNVTNTVSLMYDSVSSHPIYSESFAGGTPYVSAKENPWTETDTSSTNTYSLYIDYNLFINGDISLASGTTGFDISLTGGGSPPALVYGKIKVGGTFIDITDRKVKIGGTFVSATGYKVKISGTFVDLV